MKKIKFLLFGLVLTAMAVSCSKDEEVASVSGNKYQTTYAKISGTVGGQTVTLEYKTKAELEAQEMYVVVEFKADGTAIASNDSTPATWTQSGSNVTVVVDGQSFILTVNGNTLTQKMNETVDGGTVTVEMQFTKM
jgi:RecB family endonuclease NucS